jgi:hypothetical protein
MEGHSLKLRRSSVFAGTATCGARSHGKGFYRSSHMKTFALVLAASFLSTAAFAQDTTTTIKKEEGLFGSETTIEQKREPSTTSSTTVTTGSSIGCTTETKQKTDEFGDTTTKKTTEC